MNKKLAFLCLSCTILIMNTIPPTLYWSGTSCWNETIYLFLRNIRPLTETLVKKKSNFFSENLANEYQSLLKLAPDGKERKLGKKDLEKYQEQS
jgi:hypothetical protein